MAHAKLSPSSAHRWMNCAASVALESGIEEQGSSEYADEGTAAHYLAAQCLTHRHPAKSFIGRIIGVKDEAKWLAEWSKKPPASQFVVDDDMAESVQKYLDAIHEYANGDQLNVEVEVPIDHMTDEKKATGTADCIVMSGNGLIQVHDLKYGRGEKVDAENNPQLMMYASGALRALDPLDESERVLVVIHQPRLNHKSEWEFSIDELRLFEKRIWERAKETERLCDPAQSMTNEDFNPGEKQCRWCKAKGTCPALRDHVLATVADDFVALDAVGEKVSTAIEAVRQTDNQIIASLLPSIGLIEDWCAAVRAKATAEILAGNEIPGYKMVAGKKGARAWTSADEAEAMLKSFRLKQDEMYDFKLISPTTAEKVLKDNQRRWSKLQSLIVQKDGAPTVVPVYDKRPALNFGNPADDFEVIEEDLLN